MESTELQNLQRPRSFESNHRVRNWYRRALLPELYLAHEAHCSPMERCSVGRIVRQEYTGDRESKSTPKRRCNLDFSSIVDKRTEAEQSVVKRRT